MLKLIFWPKCCRRKANIVQSAVAQSSPSLNRREKQTIHQGGERFKTKKCSRRILKKEEKRSWRQEQILENPFWWGPYKSCSLFNAMHDKNTKIQRTEIWTSNPWKCEPQFAGAVSTHIKGVQWKRPPHSWQPLNAKETLGGGDLFLTMGIAMCHKGG